MGQGPGGGGGGSSGGIREGLDGENVRRTGWKGKGRKDLRRKCREDLWGREGWKIPWKWTCPESSDLS